jgi:hypothetical protein
MYKNEKRKTSANETLYNYIQPQNTIVHARITCSFPILYNKNEYACHICKFCSVWFLTHLSQMVIYIRYCQCSSITFDLLNICSKNTGQMSSKVNRDFI